MITHMTALDFTFWAIQFILEAIGLTLAFRKSLWPVTAYLGSRILMDTIGAFTIGPVYELSFWLGKIPEYSFQLILAFACAGEMLRESRDTIKAAAVMAGAVGIVLVSVFYVPVTYQRMLTIELVVNLLIGCVLALGLVSERTKAPWTGISWGLAIVCGAAGLNLMTGRMDWHVLARLYEPLEITGLCVLGYAAKSWQGCEFRQGLGVKIVEAEKAKGATE